MREFPTPSTDELPAEFVLRETTNLMRGLLTDLSRTTFLNALSFCCFIALLLLRLNTGIIDLDRHCAIGGAREFFAPRAVDPSVHLVTSGAIPS
jgi:hypothetical protein